MSTGVVSKGLYLSKPVVGACIAAGLGCILLVGLLSGLVARPNNCIEAETTLASTSAPTNAPTSAAASTSTRITQSKNIILIF
jgi:hypothetical protein